MANMGDATNSERYAAFVRNSSEGIWLFELDKPISVKLKPATQIAQIFERAYLAEANQAVADMYAASSPDALIGTRLPDFMPRDDPENIAYLTAFIESEYRLNGVESHEKDQHGNDKYFRNSLVGVIEDGHIQRAWGTQQDITDQRLITTALKKSEERLDLALRVSSMGLWEWDIATSTLTWSDTLKALYGLGAEEDITYETYVSMIHPEDRERCLRTIRRSMKTGQEYRMEHRIVWKDGSEHWILGQGKALFEDGNVIRMVGTGMNIEDTKRKTELEELNKKLRHQQRQLVALNRSKDEFISLASHQLRTPATGVKQYLGLLLEGYGGDIPQAQRELLEIAYGSNERQLAVLNDLLRVAQVDAGKMRLNKASSDILVLLQDVVDEQSEKFKQRNQTLLLRSSGSSFLADIDPRRMRMVFENIIDNACKYTPDGKTITIELATQPTKTVIRFKDQGIGIDKEDLPRLFHKFSRLNNALVSNIDGTGLGLYVAKKIVTLHSGTLTLRSTPGTGSTFTITLPKV